MEIKFIPNAKILDSISDKPSIAKKHIPEWYKAQEAFNPKNIEFDSKSGITNKNFKMCMPFLDSFSTGYMQTTWTDIYVENKEDGIYYLYSTDPVIMEHRNKTSIPIGEEYYEIEFIWKMHWFVELPKGYSLLLTHPLNRIDLPFTTLSGIVDGAGLSFPVRNGGSLPFYIKKGFKGIIPAGTPMYQIIPFKNDKWTSTIEKYNEDKQAKANYIHDRKFWGFYKNNFWNKKDYR